MKLRWKEQELFFVTILAIVSITGFFGNIQSTEFASPFFHNFRHVLMPQVSSVLLLLLTYFAVIGLVIPALKKVSYADIEKLFSLQLFKSAALILIISFLLALGINALSFYARPWEVNYGGFGILAIFGYNDHPLENIFSGFDRALALVAVITLITGIREIVSWLILKKESGKQFRILVTNNITFLVYIYFLGLVIINPTHHTFRIYLAQVTPSLFMYIYLSFRIFPMAEQASYTDSRIWIRLVLATLICVLPTFFILSSPANPYINVRYILILLFVVFPLSWLLYRLRADQIRQLRGFEKALAKSSADLQLLRSQINPHFLFNALNTLYGTALIEQAEKTSEGIQRLGDMMRFMLHENNQEQIDMQKEIGYLKNYIAFQKLRVQTSPDIRIEDNLDDPGCGGNIAPMLLIPFVENAFKHGVSQQSPSWINVHLQCLPGQLEFQVRNSVHHAGSQDPEHGKSGIGLTNVIQRLKLLYPGKHHLFINETTEEFQVKLTLY